QGRFTEVEQRLDRAFLDEVVAGLSEHQIVVGLPRFSARQEVDLKPILQSFGMGAAFTEAADFSGINGDTDLLLLEVGQQATIDVNESGTVAAAAAWGLGGVTSAPSSVVVDRPFLFLIREASTGAILFLGRIEDPTAG
ncbi:MAG TPA: serpin family protein, partial [Myxococcales bacterium]|nr:serpin family protein [Myxococcales bacterium]